MPLEFVIIVEVAEDEDELRWLVVDEHILDWEDHSDNDTTS